MGHGEGAGEGSPGASRDAALLALVQIAREPLAETLACAYLGWSVADLHGALDRSAGVVVRDAAGRIAPAPAARDDAPLTPEHARDHHRDLASWCGRDLATIWERSDEPQEEARRAYGRRHYVTHLALGEQWDTLWLVLDDERYARGKQAGLDSGTLAYARDLDRARAAAARQDRPFPEALALLPRLWTYSVLRCSLNSRAERLPAHYYEALAGLGSVARAVEQAELLTRDEARARTLRAIAGRLPAAGRDHLLRRAAELEAAGDGGDAPPVSAPGIPDPSHYADYQEVVSLVRTAREEQDPAERARSLGLAEQCASRGGYQQINAQAKAVIVEAYIEARLFADAERVAGSIRHPDPLLRAHAALALALVEERQCSAAGRVLDRVEDYAARFSVTRVDRIGWVLRAYFDARRFEEAERVAGLFPGDLRREAAAEIARAYLAAGRPDDAERVSTGNARDEEWRAIMLAYLDARRFADAERIAETITGAEGRAAAWLTIAQASGAGRFDQAERAALTIAEALPRTRALLAIARAYRDLAAPVEVARLLAVAEGALDNRPRWQDQATLRGEIALLYLETGHADEYRRLRDAVRVILFDTEESAERSGVVEQFYPMEAGVVRTIMRSFFQRQRFREGEQFLDWISGERERLSAPEEVVLAYINARQLEEAERRAERMVADFANPRGWHSPEEHAGFRSTLQIILSNLSKAYADAAYFDAAERALARVEPGYWRTDALTALARAYLAAQRPADAERVAAELPEWRRAEALKRLTPPPDGSEGRAGAAHPAAGGQAAISPAALLRTVQEQWLAATTLEALDPLLPLVGPLLPRDATGMVVADLLAVVAHLGRPGQRLRL